MNRPASFGVTDVAALVGIQPIQLNKFIERRKYGIVQAGKGRGKDRRFNEEDIFGIALVWWLFESGLRSDTIQFVLNQICGGRLNSKANEAAKLLVDGGAERLVITREPRRAPAKHPRQQTQPQNIARAAQIVRETSTASILIIPVGSLFANLQEEMAGTLQS
jgi:hypothetical protein